MPTPKTKKPPARKAARPASDRPQDTLAGDIMRHEIITVSRSAPLSEVERVLSENRISGVPVTDSAGRIIGVVSIRDLLDRYTEEPDARPRRNPGYYRLPTEDLSDIEIEAFEVPLEAEETAEDLMTAEVYTVRESDAVREVARTMLKHRIHRVLVVDRKGRCSGLISTMEMLGVMSR